MVYIINMFLFLLEKRIIGQNAKLEFICNIQ
jgi:hypothetical protein